MVVDRVMQVGVADSGAVLSSFGATECAVTATVGNPAEFLDVDVDHLARPIVFVAVWRLTAHRQTCGLVEVGQTRHPVAAQHRLDGRFRQVQVIDGPVGPDSACAFCT